MSHYTRDLSFDEDRTRTRAGKLPRLGILGVDIPATPYMFALVKRLSGDPALSGHPLNTTAHRPAGE